MQITTTTAGRWNIPGATMRSTRNVSESCTMTKRWRWRFPALGAQRAASKTCSSWARSMGRSAMARTMRRLRMAASTGFVAG
jgi:hypothetical protein